jgi:hypothetical protein
MKNYKDEIQKIHNDHALKLDKIIDNAVDQTFKEMNIAFTVFIVVLSIIIIPIFL